MSKINYLPVSSLSLDLNNFRTIAQDSEEHAVQAIVATSTGRFDALLDSLLDSGFLPTDTVLILSEHGKHVVKDGNRRIAAMKLILGLLPQGIVPIPASILSRMRSLSSEWSKENSQVPCVVYKTSEKAKVDKAVSLAHGKGELAGRDQWNAVARARHNRAEQSGSEPGLDLLEKYLKSRKHLTESDAAKWAGDYPLSVLEDAMGKLAKALALKGPRELAEAYPQVIHRDRLDQVLHGIGNGNVQFKTVRMPAFLSDHGFPAVTTPPPTRTTSGQPGEGKPSPAGATGKGGDAGVAGKESKIVKPKATGVHDPKTLRRLLRRLTPRGDNREKVVTLRDEAVKLNVAETPLAFCFLMRSMFEISAKAYCIDHAASGGPSAVKADGQDRNLIDVLRDITQHLTGKEKDKAKMRQIHGALTELAKPAGLLSVTSMNQLVHNARFHVGPSDILTLFSNIFPLLEEMNA